MRMRLEELLPPDCLQAVAQFTEPVDVARAMCCSRAWASVWGQDAPWENHVVGATGEPSAAAIMPACAAIAGAVVEPHAVQSTRSLYLSLARARWWARRVSAMLWQWRSGAPAAELERLGLRQLRGDGGHDAYSFSRGGHAQSEAMRGDGTWVVMACRCE